MSFQLTIVRDVQAILRRNYGTFRGWVRHLLTEAHWLTGRLDPVIQPDLSQVRRLVFVCLGNINRSCFAECVAKQAGAVTGSFGLSTTTGAAATGLAIATAGKLGLDLSTHTATDMRDFKPQEGDLLLLMEVRHLKRLRASRYGNFPMALLGSWGHPRRLHLHDPDTLSAEYFKTCFTLIESATREVVREWRQASSSELH